MRTEAPDQFLRSSTVMAVSSISAWMMIVLEFVDDDFERFVVLADALLQPMTTSPYI